MIINLFLFAFLYLSDFSHVYSLQFTGRGFCAATEEGVFVYDNQDGVVVSYPMKKVYLASYDLQSREIAFITKSGTLYVYSPFFERLRRVISTKDVIGMGFNSGIIMLIYQNGLRRYITKLGQVAPSIHIDTIYETKPRQLPLYLRTRTYEDPCHTFSSPTSYVRGYNLDYVGTWGSGVYVFDNRMRKLEKRVYVNVQPPVYRLEMNFDTLYILHSAGITKISGGYVNSIPLGCFHEGFKPVDFLYLNNKMLVLGSTGFYALENPYFFTPLDESCGKAIATFTKGYESFIVSEHCIYYVNEKGGVNKFANFSSPIDFATSFEGKVYVIVNNSLYVLQDTILSSIDYKDEPIITRYLIRGSESLYVPAKRGLFVISNGEITRLNSPFNLRDVVSGFYVNKKLYLALSNKVILCDVEEGRWDTVDFGTAELNKITSLMEFDNKIYVGYEKGVLVK